MKVLPQILLCISCIVIGAAGMYFFSQSEEADAIAENHRTMIVTVTKQARLNIDSIRAENKITQQIISDLRIEGNKYQLKIDAHKMRETLLNNRLNELYEKLPPRDYDFGAAGNVDSAAYRLIGVLPPRG